MTKTLRRETPYPGLLRALTADCAPCRGRLHQTLWYLHEALCLLPAEPIWNKIECLLEESGWDKPAACVPRDPEGYEARANVLLHRAWSLTRQAVGHAAPAGNSRDFLGKDFKAANLSGADFAMALLIAADLSGCNLYGANLLGADLRDANLRGADLSECLFLTQGQLGAAHGDKTTLLPPALAYPEAWLEIDKK